MVVELPVMDEDDVETGEYSQEILDMDIVNEIFCGDVQDMFILAFYVIRLNFNGFFQETRRPIWESRRGYSEEDEEDIVKYGKLDTSQFSELELRMYILIKAKLASMFGAEGILHLGRGIEAICFISYGHGHSEWKG